MAGSAEDAEGNVPILDAEGERRRRWVDKALQSNCAKRLDEIFKGKNPTYVAEFKEEVFQEIYSKIGTDPKLAEDLEGALVVKNVKFMPWQVCCLVMLSCGIFYLIRPADDDAILVLTKQGRVITLKLEREGFFSGNALHVILTFMKYVLAFAFALSVPSMLLWAFLSGTETADELGVSSLLNMHIDEELLRKIRRHYVIASEVFLSFLLVFMIWLWSKCPHDYGSRFRECYTASTVSAGQLTIQGKRGRRQSVMRLYFGKYPTQAMLDQHGVVSSSQGTIVRSIPPKSLAAAGSTGGGVKDAKLLKRPSAGSMAGGLIVVLSILTMTDTALTWLNRASAAGEAWQTSKFCKDAPLEESYCTPARCKQWAKEFHHGSTFCLTVEWHGELNDNTQRATCAYYGHLTPPCCGGCGVGQALAAVQNAGWLSLFQELLGVVGDVGTLVFSLMAAIAAVAVNTTADVFDVRIQQVRHNRAMSQTSNFEFTGPCALNFFHQVFYSRLEKRTKHRDPHFSKVVEMDNTPKNTPKHSTSAPVQATEEQAQLLETEDTSQGVQGVSNFEKDNTSEDWDTFFAGKSLAEKQWGQWYAYKVNVPMRCLGIIDDDSSPEDPRAETVVAAWSERPALSMAALMVPIICAFVVTLLLTIAPRSVTGTTFYLPGVGHSAFGHIFSAIIAGGAIVVLALLYQCFAIFVNGVEHAVVVTDQRLFYIRYQPPCRCLCQCALAIRVDCFRHDRDVIYGSVTGTSLSFFHRLTGATWRAGHVLMQNKMFGVLQLTRRHGNVFTVFNVVTQLTSETKAGFLKQGVDEADLAWDWAVSKDEAELALERLRPGVRVIRPQPQDLSEGPAIYLVASRDERGKAVELELPIFHWSFQDKGPLSSPFDATTDVLVTTGRVFIWKRSIYKRFNCKTSFCWGFCWCGWLSATAHAGSMPYSISFFVLPMLLSFSTTTVVEPPLWTDPTHLPMRFPIYDTCCSGLTKMMTCDCGELGAGLEDFSSLSPLPLRTKPKTQLWMMWRLKTCAQQADLMASVKPFEQADFEDIDLLRSLSCCGMNVGPTGQTEHFKKMEVLRIIMGVAQDEAANDELQRG